MKNHNLYCFKALLCISVIFTLNACGKSESDSPAQSTQSKGSSMEIASQFSMANKEMRSFAAKNGLMEDPRINAADLAANAAYQEVTALRKSHPELKAFYDESEAFKDQAVKAKLAGDDAGFKQSMSDYQQTRMKLESAAAKLPEIQAAQKQMDLIAENQTFVICDVVAESGPEGEKMAENVRNLLKELQALKP